MNRWCRKECRDEIEALKSEVNRLTALRCDCDEESGNHAPTCAVMVREQNAAMAAEIAHLRAAAAEREADMHARIRAGYDKTVADTWRAEVAKLDAEVARLTAEFGRLTAELAEQSERAREADAARGILGAANGETLIRAAQRVITDARMQAAELAAELAATRAEVDCGQDGPCAKAPGCARHWQERNRELVAELAAARAVPADVESAIDVTCAAWSNAQRGGFEPSDESLYDAARNRLRTAIARTIREAAAGASATVGGLLATAPRGTIVEYVDSHGRWRQCMLGNEGSEPVWCDRAWVAGRWLHWSAWMGVDVDAFVASGRRVDEPDVNTDPSQRGPLPKGG